MKAFILSITLLAVIILLPVDAQSRSVQADGYSPQVHAYWASDSDAALGILSVEGIPWDFIVPTKGVVWLSWACSKPTIPRCPDGGVDRFHVGYGVKTFTVSQVAPVLPDL